MACVVRCALCVVRARTRGRSAAPWCTSPPPPGSPAPSPTRPGPAPGSPGPLARCVPMPRRADAVLVVRARGWGGSGGRPGMPACAMRPAASGSAQAGPGWQGGVAGSGAGLLAALQQQGARVASHGACSRHRLVSRCGMRLYRTSLSAAKVTLGMRALLPHEPRRSRHGGTYRMPAKASSMQAPAAQDAFYRAAALLTDGPAC